MNVIHLMVSGGTGGIESLMKNYSLSSTHHNVFVFAWAGGYNADLIRENGTSVYVLDKNSCGSRGVIKHICRICKEEKADVVVTHYSAPLLKLAAIWVRCVMPTVKVIEYAHANAVDMCTPRKRGVRLRKIFQKWAFNRANKIVAISQSVQKSLVDYLKVRNKNITVVYNGVPLDHFCAEQAEKNIISSTKLELVYVGRLVPEKGVQVIFEALSLLNDKNNYHLNIVGDGPYREELEKYAEMLKISGNISFHGNIRDVFALLKQSHCFIHAPIWEEGFGITIIEAMASGLYCICAKSGAIPEIITDGENGVLFEKESSKELAEKIADLNCALSNNREGVERIKRNARVRAQDFSIDRFVRELDALVSDCN